MRAFESAMLSGADGFELDVRLSACGELVVFHDEDLQRMCGDARLVGNIDWKELSELRVQGHAIPLLRDVIASFPEALINIELKRHPMAQAMDLVRATLTAIDKNRALARVLVSSFDPRLLALSRLLDPNVPRALLCAREQAMPLRRGWCSHGLRLAAIHPEEVLVTAHSVANAHHRGQQVNTWTVDDPKRLRELASFGVDALICNDPSAALLALEEDGYS